MMGAYGDTRIWPIWGGVTLSLPAPFCFSTCRLGSRQLGSVPTFTFDLPKTTTAGACGDRSIVAEPSGSTRSRATTRPARAPLRP